MTAPLTIVRYSAMNAVADFRATYTVTSWTCGWLGRMLTQVLFFTLAGELFHSAELTRYLVLGNSVMTCAIEAMMVVASSTWERRAGTLPLLMIAPVQLGYVFVGRSLQWPISGSATSLISLFALAPLFGVRWSVGAAFALVPVVLLTALATYAFGLALAAVVLPFSDVRNIASNAAYLVMMAICGVQVPTDFWPSWVRVVAAALPLTHGLRAVRDLADSAAAPTVWRSVAFTAVAGAAWLLVALAVFRIATTHARRHGSSTYS